MYIKSITILNYRSIKKAKDIPFSKNMTILIGKNNEGKSNILKALSGSFLIISLLKKVKKERLKFFLGRTRRRDDVGFDFDYDWFRDYPISKQKYKKGKTEFRLNFILSKEEQQEFKKSVGHTFNENLPFHILFSQDDIEIKIPKKSRGSSNQEFSKDIDKISKFVSNKLDSIYIPTIRPARTSIEIVEKLIERDIRKTAETRQEYADAKKIMDKILKESIDTLSGQITAILKDFVPNIKKVEIDYNEIRYFSSRLSAEIKIDDGAKTSIYEKGDGLKSIVALSLMQGTNLDEKDLTIAIEEPESHLHPEAIRRIKNILYNLSKKNQIIITTHSPILVNRENLSSNIIVRNNEVFPVRYIPQIREELGIAVSDNLCGAEYVLLLEGKTDIKSLTSIFTSKSPVIQKALQDGTLILHDMKGAKNFVNTQRFFQSLIYKKIITYMDNDKTAQAVYNQALKEQLIEPQDIIFAKINGKEESEFEDILNECIYTEFLPQSLPDWKRYLHNNKKKWSDNIKDLYSYSGNPLNIEELKEKISDKVSKDPQSSLDDKKCSTINSLIGKLEKILDNKGA